MRVNERLEHLLDLEEKVAQLTIEHITLVKKIDKLEASINTLETSVKPVAKKPIAKKEVKKTVAKEGK